MADWKRTALAIALVVLCPGSILTPAPAQAHDCWIFPEQFVLARGDTLVVRQRFGHELDVEVEFPLDRDYVESFELISATGRVNLLDEAPEQVHPTLTPLLKREMDFEGPVLLAMEHGFLPIDLTDKAFTRHLEYEGLDEIVALRDRQGHEDNVRERYARSMKSLIRVGERAEGDVHKEILGQRMEILLLKNPLLLDAGDTLRIQVLFSGEPLGDKRVWALNRERDGGVSLATSRTDSSGVASFELDREGLWLIRLVHELPCTRCPRAGWEGYWASYSFELD